MNVADLYERLSHGELSNLAMALDGEGSIKEDQQKKVIVAANEALMKLYSRFVLKEKDVIIRLFPHITNYHFLKKFTVSEGDQHTLYIEDRPEEPFTEDMIKILSVYGNSGLQIPLNDNEQPASLFTPQATVLQVPRPLVGAALSVMYQAKHPVLEAEDSDQWIEVPDVLEGAFLSYIAFKIFTQMNTQESIATGQIHYAAYESSCQEAIDKDLVSTSTSTTNTRFQKRGWI